MAHRDPPKADPNADAVDTALFGAPAKVLSGLMHFTNPLNFITADFPPIYIQHGSEDKTVPVIHSYQLEEKVRAVCGSGRAELKVFQGYDHGGIDLRWNAPENDDMVFRFLDKHMK
jgi:dipeptidyl aminopeptidase/acylaminoacyl peptidase